MTEPVTEQNAPKQSIIVQVTVILAAFMLYTTSLATPALSAIYADFPEYSTATVKLVQTAPTLMLCVFSLVSGWMTTKISIKKTAMIAMALQFLGILPAFMGGLEFLIVMRFVFGAGYGLMFPLASAMVTDLFYGAKRNQMMGFKSAFGALAGVIFQTLGGILTVYSWRYAFLGLLLIIPIFIMILIFLPDTGAKKQPKSEAGEKQGKIKPFLIVVLVAAFFFNTFFYQFMLNITFVITNEEIGTSVDAANVLNMFTAFAFVAGLIYGPISKVCKRFMIIVAAALVGISFIFFEYGGSLAMLLIGGGVFGLGFGFSNPTFTLIAASCVTHNDRAPLALSIYTSVVGIGQFVSVYIVDFIVNVANVGGLRPEYFVSMCALLGGTVVAFILMLIIRPKKKEAAA